MQKIGYTRHNKIGSGKNVKYAYDCLEVARLENSGYPAKFIAGNKQRTRFMEVDTKKLLKAYQSGKVKPRYAAGTGIAVLCVQDMPEGIAVPVSKSSLKLTK